MTWWKPLSTPLAPHFKLSIQHCAKIEVDKVEVSKVPYFSVVGSLIYVMTGTRINLAHSKHRGQKGKGSSTRLRRKASGSYRLKSNWRKR